MRNTCWQFLPSALKLPRNGGILWLKLNVESASPRDTSTDSSALFCLSENIWKTFQLTCLLIILTCCVCHSFSPYVGGRWYYTIHDDDVDDYYNNAAFVSLHDHHEHSVWAREHCRISPPRFLAECRMRQLNQGSFVLLCFASFAFSGLCLVCVLSVFLICLLSCIFQRESTWMALWCCIVIRLQRLTSTTRRWLSVLMWRGWSQRCGKW